MVAFSKTSPLFRQPKVYTFVEYLRREEKAVETRFREEADLWRIRIKTENNINHSIPLRSLGVSISLADIYEDIVFPEKKINLLCA